MKIEGRQVSVFKIKNRRGFAAVYSNHLTEGRTIQQAFDRMVKAIRRKNKRKK